MKKRKKEIPLVDNLKFFSLISIIRKYGFCREVFYLHRKMDIFSRLFIFVLSRFGWKFVPITYDMLPVENTSPYKEVHSLLISKIKECEKLLRGPMQGLKGVSDYEKERMLGFFGKRAGYEIYFQLKLSVLLSFGKILSGKKVRVFLKKTFFSGIVQSAYEKIGIKTVFYNSPDKDTFLKREGYLMDGMMLNERRNFLRSLTVAIFLLANSFFYRTWVFLFDRKKPLRKHKICVLILGSKATHLSSGLPWAGHGQRQNDIKEEILTMCSSSLPEKTVDFYVKASDRLVAYDFNPFRPVDGLEMKKSRAAFMGYFLENLKFYKGIFGFNGIKMWMTKYISDILVYLSFFESVFRLNQTRILWTMTEYDYQTQAAAMAMNRVGGVSFGTTMSHFSQPLWELQRNQNDIQFVWGKRAAGIKKIIFDRCDSFVLAGYPADAMFTSEFKKAKRLREDITGGREKSKVLTLYDEIAWNDFEMTPKKLMNIYGEIFTWLEDDADNFFIIKAKTKNTLDFCKKVKEKIENFSREKRVLVIHEKAAIYAGLAADAVLGTSLSLTSIVALLGRPVIYCDIHNVTEEYPVNLPGFITIHDTKKIREALNKALEKNQVSRPERPPEPLKGSSIDPFADGNSGKRMCQYMKDVMQKIDQGFTNEKALNFANEKYGETWGRDTVIPGPLRIRKKNV